MAVDESHVETSTWKETEDLKSATPLVPRRREKRYHGAGKPGPSPFRWGPPISPAILPFPSLLGYSFVQGWGRGRGLTTRKRRVAHGSQGDLLLARAHTVP